MKLTTICTAATVLATLVSSTIWQNNQVKDTNYPDTKINPSSYQFKDYAPNSPELSYKGRWDSKYISWWSAPGLKFGFTGNQVAITFGQYTVDATLIAYRVSGQDWQFTNVTANATHLLVTSKTPAVDLTSPVDPKTFELRVTNWAYGVQLSKVHVAKGERLIKLKDYSRSIEVIGDSLSSGYATSLEGLSSYAYGTCAGLGNTEYSITAFPGICLQDKLCWGHKRGMLYQWFTTSDASGRAEEIWGGKEERWDFSKHKAADIVIINLGTNDANSYNIVDPVGYEASYKLLISGVHAVWPKAQIVLLSLWIGFSQNGNTYNQIGAFTPEINNVYQYFNSREYLQNPVLYDPIKNQTYKSRKPSAPFVHLFDTTGILQHNDMSPAYHPTDTGNVKVANQLMQYIKLKFGWKYFSTGPEVFHDTLYWNDEVNY